MKKSAFTLIELLIVVAIIAILAAIAVPNFLEAQVRSKVSRSKTDIRTFATALEAYAVDHTKYPPFGSDPIVLVVGAEPQFLEPRFLTSPIAYVSSAAIFWDPFRSKIPAGSETMYRQYDYVNFDDIRYRDAAFAHERYGFWRITGSGPDTWRFNTGLNGPDSSPLFGVITYDPTNGTVSVGDIYRTQKYTEPQYHFQ